MILCLVATLTLIILVKQSKYLEYYFKIIAFSIAIFSITSFLILPYISFRPKDYRNGFLPAWAGRRWMRLMGITYEIRGIDNINVKRGGIVLINHQSIIDVGVICFLYPIIGRITIVARNLIRYALPALYCYGTLFIDNNNKRDAVEKLSQQSAAIRNDSAKLILFPEGKRNQGDRLLPFKKGPFHTAVQSQSSIQPVVVSGYDFLDANRKIFNSGHIIISVLPEIECGGMTVEDIAELTERCQNLMQGEFERISSKSI